MAATVGRDRGVSYAWLLAALGVLVMMLFAASLTTGQTRLPMAQTLSVWWHGDVTLATLVLTQLRLPRACLGLMVGASLGLAGAAMQGLLRNPLAEPGIVGISGCAAFGAVLVFYTGLTQAVPLALPLGGIAGALLSVVLLYLLAGRSAGTLSLILAGVAINAFAGALTALALNLSPNPFAAMEIVFWQMGSLADRSLTHLWLSGPLMLAGWAMLLGTGRALDALTLGEETAGSLGISLIRLRARIIVGTALSVGSAVAVTGVIGFVGLVVPHLLRPLVGYQPARLLLASALGGAALLLASDIAVRELRMGPELKLGVVTALVGAPFFLWLVRRLQREMA